MTTYLRLLLAALVAAAALTAPAAANALVPLGSDFRVATTGSDGDNRDGFTPQVAYNSQANEFLVVWESDGHTNDDQLEIYGQRLAPSGAEIGDDFRISNTTEVGATRDATSADVAYNPQSNEYLVTWRADELATDDEHEVFGQRVSATGAQIGGDFRISNVGSDASTATIASGTAVAYNSQANQFLVVWQGDVIDDRFEISGQRVSATGTEVGIDFQISDAAAVATNRDAFAGAVAYNSQSNEYLVTWEGDELATQGETEIFGQRVSAAGGEVGPDDFRISNVGTDGVVQRDGSDPAVEYNPKANEYLVVWAGDGLATDNDEELFGQRIASAGAELGGDFRISTTGADGDGSIEAEQAALAYSPADDGFLVVYQAEGTGVDQEFETYGQQVSADAAGIGPAMRISHAGPDADPARQAFDPAVAYSPASDRYLTAWSADALAGDDKFEVFGHLLGTVAPPSPPAAAPADKTVELKLKFAKLQRAIKARAIVVTASCPAEACTVAADGSLGVPGASAAKSFKLAKVKRSLDSGKSATLKLKLSKKAIKAAKRALARRRTVRAKVKVTAADPAGNRSDARAAIKLKR